MGDARETLYSTPKVGETRNEDDRPNKLQHGMDKHFCKRDFKVYVTVYRYVLPCFYTPPAP